MTTARIIALVLAFGLLGSTLASAQERDDPLIKALEGVVAEFGGRKKLEDDPEFQQSKAGWAEAAKEIAAAIKDQDAALAGSKADADRLMTLYGSRANSRGKPVDHYLHGRLLGLTGHLDDAYQSFSRALQLDRFFYWAWDGLGVYHSNKENWAEAKVKFERVLQINRGYLKAAFGRAQCMFQTGDIPGASMQLREILDQPGARDDVQVIRQARLLLAEAFRTTLDYDAAIRELSQLEKDGMREVHVYAMRAWCSKQLERWKEAINDYDSILKLDAGEIRYHLHKADALMKLGRNADAIESFETYLKVAAGMMEAKEEQSIRDTIDQLRGRPAVENPKSNQRNLKDVCDTALLSPHREKRREAILLLSKHPPVYDPKDPVTILLRQTFANALREKEDPVVLAKALEQMNERFWDPVQLQNLTKMFARQSTGGAGAKDPIVRGMACHLLQNYDPKSVVPVLILAMQEENDLYVFRAIHESLNVVTLAWIDRLLPTDLEARDITAIRAKWVNWYKKNRDIYRRNEPTDFSLESQN